MSNQSFSDLPSQQRRERIAAELALGLARILDPKVQNLCELSRPKP